MRRFHLLLSFLLLAATLSAAEPGPSFNRDIRPILSDKCFTCHGPDKEARKAGLRLDTEAGATADREGLRAVVPGQPAASELIKRINATDPDEVMPPPDSHLSLSPNEKERLRRWIAEGATWEQHWAFEPIASPAQADEPNMNPIDRFVRAELDRIELQPAPEADRVTWLRRVTQDLTGLPPTLAATDAFLADDSPYAHERVVDRLLAGEDYAERMTGIWLDNARYADSNGFQFDNQRSMWPWRDWVIAAFRRNMPYDQFVTEQLAGDLLDQPTREQLIATGFNRNHGYSIEGGIIDEEYRVLYANDKTTTFGTLFLGLTMDCTRCHDHKYDPLSMTDYYSLYAFFNTSAERGAPGVSGRKLKSAAPFLELTTGANGAKEKEPTRAMIMKEEARETRILLQGLFDQPGELVTPRTPAVLPSFDGFATNRLGLARWLVAAENPLFARVTVNRLWQQFFGVGLVKTPDNFGLQGAQPSHPELLDWLAAELRDNDWDLHHVIRQIVLSETYRQRSAVRTEVDDPENRLLARGPRFRLPAELIRDQALAASGLLTRTSGGPSVFPYQPAGVWADLNAPKSHAEIYKQSSEPDLYRKSLYTYWRRAVLHPAMAAFDAPSRDVCAVERSKTNTPLQALVTLHGPTYVEAARRLAEDAVREPDPIEHAFRRILTRVPEARELQRLSALHQSRLKHFQAHPEDAARLLQVGAHPAAADLDAAEVAAIAALADVCHVIFNLSESLTRK